MMKDEIEKAILNYEEGINTLEDTIALIHSLTQKKITAYTLQNYWRSEKLENFVNRLVMPAITDWKSITDEEALVLLEEMLSDVTNDAVLERNANALRKRYAKPNGFLMDLIFYREAMTAIQLLLALKADTTLHLD